ncbi:MAG: zinc-finger domain-containing protein [Francisellaceae bacterium]
MPTSIQTIFVEKGQRICCPTPETPSWNQHPRVYIDLEDVNEGVCPYCSTHFIVKDNITTTDSDK